MCIRDSLKITDTTSNIKNKCWSKGFYHNSRTPNRSPCRNEHHTDGARALSNYNTELTLTHIFTRPTVAAAIQAIDYNAEQQLCSVKVTDMLTPAKRPTIGSKALHRQRQQQ